MERRDRVQTALDKVHRFIMNLAFGLLYLLLIFVMFAAAFSGNTPVQRRFLAVLLCLAGIGAVWILQKARQFLDGWFLGRRDEQKEKQNETSER
jgi:uncharacterized membrane protein YqjE